MEAEKKMVMGTMMQAMVMTTAGSPEVLQRQTLPRPDITAPHQVLIRLQGAGVNPIDTKLRQRGTFYPQAMPAILGCDGAGTIEAIGEAVPSMWQRGQAVYYCAGGLGAPQTGNYAEWAVVPHWFLAPKPETLSFAEAAAVPLALITAWEALYDRGRLTANQTVLIHAGAGGVGHLAIQLAKQRGARVCTTVSTPDKARLARQLGADEVILYPETDWAAAVLAWTEGQGVDLAFDTVGGALFFDTCPVVKIYGDLVTILEPDSSLGNLKIARNRNLRISLELMLTPSLLGLTSAQAYHGKILTEAAPWFERGELRIHLSETFPLAEAAQAHHQIETGHTTGKIALLM